MHNSNDCQHESLEDRISRWNAVYRSRLLGIIRAKCFTGEEAMDVLQEVFLNGWRFLDAGGEINDDWAWLVASALRQGVDFSRKRGSDYRRRAERAADEPGLAHCESTIDEIIQEEQYRREEAVQIARIDASMHALNMLSPEERAAIEACVLEGQMVSRWARQMNIKYKAAQRLKNKGIRALREMLKEFNP